MNTSSYAAFQMVHPPTGIDTCAAAYLTHSPPGRSDFDSQVSGSGTAGPSNGDSSAWGTTPRISGGTTALPNLVVTKANVIEVYYVRVQEGDEKNGLSSDNGQNSSTPGSTGTAWSTSPAAAKRGGYMSGITAAWLELVCHYRLHGNIESMAVLSYGRDGIRRRRDAIVLSFRDAKFSVLEFDDSKHRLRTSSLHFYEGPEHQHLKRGREKFSTGPLARADSQGRCAAVLVYGCQLVMLIASQADYGLGEDESKSNVYARIESSDAVDLRGFDMKHIKDFVFLHGFMEPAVVVLHEQEPTWAGRVAMKQHTCSVTALSINADQKQHTVIWSATNLPYDAYQLLPVPSPVGGVLIVCTNSLHYQSQSSSCSLGLNEFAVAPEGSPEMPRAKFDTELDAAHITWISFDVAIISTKTGTLLLLTLIFDGRNVQRLELSMSRASVLSSCICTIGDVFFFLGSRLGDSLLVQFTSGATINTAETLQKTTKDEHDDIEEDVILPPGKRLKRASSDVSQDGFSAEDVSLYNSSYTSTDVTKGKNFSFSVRDSFVNIGPLRDFAYGLQVSADSSTSLKENMHELVACSGHGKNGSISVLSRSIRPELITEVELPGCIGVWTVYYKLGRANNVESTATRKLEEEEYHAYLIISLETRTMVLETGETLGEVTESVEYYTQGPTVCAGNLFSRRRIAQVYARGVRLLDGALQTQDLQIGSQVSETNSGDKPENIVVAASFADPYITLQMKDGSVQLITGDSETYTISVSSPSALNDASDPVTASTLYHDKGPKPWLRTTSGDPWHTLGVPDPLERGLTFGFEQGDIYCIVCRESGILEIYELPSVSCVYKVEHFTDGKRILSDKGTKGKMASSNSIDTDNSNGVNESNTHMKAIELCMEKWGEKFSRPYLFAILNDGTVIAYRAFCFEHPESSSSMQDGSVSGMVIDNDNNSTLGNLHFVRLQLDLFLEEETDGNMVPPKIIPFKNVGGTQGVFLTGARPVWLMIFRERIRAHPQVVDGRALAFTALHNINCQHGLIYITDQGLLKICQLPSLLNYDCHWPVQKIPLRGTPHQITYHSDMNLYALIVSFNVSVPASVVLPSLDQPGNQAEQTDHGNGEDGNKLVMVDEYEVRVLRPAKQGVAWETKGKLKMQTMENALTVRIVNVKNLSTDQTQNLLAIGTAFAQGEDVAIRGRIILLSLGPDPNDANSWVREVYSKELKGAISAIASLQGHLLVAIGPKIILHTWNGSELNGTAFFDAPLYVVSLNIVKNFVLFGDIHKSVYFLCWKEEGAQLVLLAKDFGALDCYATEFMIDGSILSLMVSDSRKNIQIFSYAPKSVESWKGQKLLSKAEFHVGAHITKFLRLQMLPTSPTARSNRFALYFGTLDGGIGYVAPVDELTFRRLKTLQPKLIDAVGHIAGLNPRAFRQFRSDGASHRPGPDTIVDCELLAHYEDLPMSQQMVVARQIGSTRSQILANLRDLSVSTNFF